MMNESVEGVPWLEKDGCTTVTATVIEGAEVVRTAAVSYATPILHQVFIQGGSPVAPDSTTVKSSSEYKSYRLDVGSTSSPHSSGLTNGNDCSDKSIKENASLHLPSFLVSSDSSFSHSSSNSSTSSSSSSPVWVFSPTLLSSNSMVLRPVTSSKSSSTFSYQSSPLVSPSTVVSSLASTSTSSVLSPSSLFCSSGVTKTDDELTSLTWLQDSNLLMGTALSPIKQFTPPKSAETPNTEKKRNARSSGRKDSHSSPKKHDEAIELTLKSTPDNGKHETHEEYKIESPTSDYAEEVNELSPAEGSEVAENCVGRTSTPKPQAIPYNPKVHVKAKPPFSFSCLIFMAIEESPTKALPVKDIYSWILEHYPYYRNAPTGWKNSVRHNLSLNKCFSKVEKAQNLGKGSLWMVDPTFRPNLLQAMSKTPFTTQSKNDKTYLMSNKAVINTKYLYGLTSKTSEKAISMGDFVVENEVDILPSTRAAGNETVNVESSEALSNSNIEISNAINTSSSLGKLTVGTETRNVSEEMIKIKPNLYSPDPELFPRLAKRLGTHKMDSFSINFQSEDVDAAAAMLVLKHGPRMLSPYHETFSNMKNSISGFDSMENNLEKRIHKNSDSSDSGSVVISSSPSLDHAYVSKNGVSSQERYILRGKKETISPASSVDEAFFDDSFESETFGDHPVPSWQDGSRPFEEADALLNLASVATSLASRERFLIPAVENDDRLSSNHCSIGLSQNDMLALQSTESQPSYSETQSNMDGTSPDSLNVSSTKPKNTTKRKLVANLKLPTAKKLATINSATNNLATKNSSKLISQNKYLNNNYNNNNNNNNSRIINKNKVKVRKLLKSNKLKY